MPRKIATNSKAEAARERKEEVKQTKKSAAAKALEDSKWQDEGSTASEQRARAKAAKDAEEAKKRAEKKALQQKEEAEAAALSGKAKGVSNADKMTRAQLLRQAEEAEARRKLEVEARRLEALKLAPQEEPAPNLNRALSEQREQDVATYGAGNVIYASGIEGAIASTAGKVLTTAPSSAASAAASSIDAHPEKRMKTAHAEFEDRMMPIVKEDNPHLKLSQYKEIIFKM